MKLLFNANSMVPPLTGVGIYTSELTTALEEQPTVESIQYFLDDMVGERASINDLIKLLKRIQGGERELKSALPRNVPLYRKLANILSTAQTRDLPAIQSVKHWLLSSPLFDFRLRADAKRRKGQIDTRNFIYHETNFVLMPHDGPKLVTIHDLSILRFPELHPAERKAFMNRRLERSIRDANHIITPSEFVRGEVIEYFNLDETSVTAIPLGLARTFSSPTKIEHLELPNHYILLVGTLEPRKNITRFVEAYSMLTTEVQAEFPIVHFGPLGWNHDEISETIARQEAKGQFIRLGYVAAEHLPQVYAGASVVAYPSLYEGFGFPVIEALAYDTPVIVSWGSSMDELIQDEFPRFEPTEVDEIVDALKKVLTNLEHYTKVASDYDVTRFSWHRCAEETAKVYKAVEESCSY